MKSLQAYIMEGKEQDFTLAFFKVNNDGDLERHTCDKIYDDLEQIIAQIKKLDKSEYELIDYGKSTMSEANEEVDILNDWDDDVQETMEWDDDELKEHVKYYKELTGRKDFEKWIMDRFVVAIPASIDKVKQMLK